MVARDMVSFDNAEVNQGLLQVVELVSLCLILECGMVAPPKFQLG